MPLKDISWEPDINIFVYSDPTKLSHSTVSSYQQDLGHSALLAIAETDFLEDLEHLETIPFIIAKHTAKNLLQEVNNFHTENIKTVKMETEDKTRSLKYLLCTWIGRIDYENSSVTNTNQPI